MGWGGSDPTETLAACKNNVKYIFPKDRIRKRNETSKLKSNNQE